MKTATGIWIDHESAVIVMIADTNQTTRHIASNVEKQQSRINGSRPGTSFEPQQLAADGARERKYKEHMKRFYDEVIAVVKDSGSVMVMGPGEAKGEFCKRMDHEHRSGKVVAMETVDKMTDNEIVAKVREYFANKYTKGS